MSVLVTNLTLGLDEPEQNAVDRAVKIIGLPSGYILGASIYKKSLDARKKGRIRFVVSVIADLGVDEEAFCAQKNNPNLKYIMHQPALPTPGTEYLDGRIVVAGFGPAGIFCAYMLAKMGYHPLIIERGCEIERRVLDVEAFWEKGRLSANSNVQFGEGGAGTFSDGKLTTRISDQRCQFVLELLNRFGAPEEILTKSKPHIGTDKLRDVIRNLRKEIIRLGGEIRFQSKLESLHHKSGKLVGITVGGEYLAASQLILAVGHSARDTFEMLAGCNIGMQAKDFSVGLRIEHLQSSINQGLYGKLAGHPALPSGEYQLSYRQGNRGVYTFCMCPGGTVVPSSSEQGGVVTNGMSEFQRDRDNANSALVVSVSNRDFGTGILDGMRFQQKLEQAAFQAGGKNYSAPSATVDMFLKEKAGLNFKRVAPSYSLGVTAAPLHRLFPTEVSNMLRQGLEVFDRRLNGFGAPDSILTGVETRTSSPVRILRNESLQSVSMEGLYPCGEGAGYAGGIMSAAVDGIRVAEKIISRYMPG